MNIHRVGLWPSVVLVAAVALIIEGRAAELPRGEAIGLSYRSEVDDTDQPYTVYLPTSLTGDGPWPLAVVLHGTSGSHETYLKKNEYGGKALKTAAEKHRISILCPQGRGATEWWAIGENDVFRALGDFRQRFAVDAERIYLTGHSMGGGGTTYLALRYPDVFAAGAPMVGTLHCDLAENARYTPFYFSVGSREIEPRLRYIRKLSGMMDRFGYEPRLEIVPGATHGSFVPESWEKILAWFQGKRRAAEPQRITHRATMAQYGRAWWICIDALDKPGLPGRLEARSSGNVLTFEPDRVSAFRVFPGQAGVDLSEPLRLLVDEQQFDLADVSATAEIFFEKQADGGDDAWTIRIAPLHEPDRGAYREREIARAENEMTVKAATKYNLAFWAADALRDAAGTDIAIHLLPHYRGVPIARGSVTEDDIIQAIRPGLSPVCFHELTGAKIESLIEANLGGATFSFFVSGMRYRFDPHAPAGERLIWTDLDPKKQYTVCFRENLVLRKQMRIPDGISMGDYQILPYWNHGAYYRYALQQGTLRVSELDRIVAGRREPARSQRH